MNPSWLLPGDHWHQPYARGLRAHLASAGRVRGWYPSYKLTFSPHFNGWLEDDISPLGRRHFLGGYTIGKQKVIPNRLFFFFLCFLKLYQIGSFFLLTLSLLNHSCQSSWWNILNNNHHWICQVIPLEVSHHFKQRWFLLDDDKSN